MRRRSRYGAATKVTISVPPQLLERLLYTCAKAGNASKSAVIVQAMDLHLPQLPTSADPAPPVPALTQALGKPSARHEISFRPLRKNGITGTGVCTCGKWKSKRPGTRPEVMSWGNVHVRFQG